MAPPGPLSRTSRAARAIVGLALLAQVLGLAAPLRTVDGGRALLCAPAARGPASSAHVRKSRSTAPRRPPLILRL